MYYYLERTNISSTTNSPARHFQHDALNSSNIRQIWLEHLNNFRKLLKLI